MNLPYYALISSALPDSLLMAQGGSSFWMPEQASTEAGPVDFVFNLIMGISIFFFVLIVLLMVIFVIRYRRRPGVKPQPSPSHSTALEVTWTVIPLVIVVLIFYLGFVTYVDLRMPPGNPYEVGVTAQRWSWSFQYPNGYVEDTLHVPVDRPVLLTMTSEDVIHSLYVPAFRIKMDVVPGRYTKTWFQAVRPGQFDLYCTEYCGTGHSDMTTSVVVHESGEFEGWLEDASNFLERMPPEEAGELLTRKFGCVTCHSRDGAVLVGPSFKGIFGETHTFTNGTQAQVDENYIRESILDPMAKIRLGYQGVMNTYKGRLKDEEITAIIEYIKSLK